MLTVWLRGVTLCADCMATRSECVLTEWLRGVSVC